MKIVENPNKKLESVDLIDDDGTLLRITSNNVCEVIYGTDTSLDFSKSTYGSICYIPKQYSKLQIRMQMFGNTVWFEFSGEDAVKISESLHKLGVV